MQRWFFLEDRKKPKTKPPEKKMTTKGKPKPEAEVLHQLWTFTVSVPEIGPKEKVYITGSTIELGAWDHTMSLLMEHDPGTDMWSKTVTIPNTCDVFYRYAICTVIEDSNQLVVQRWETNIKPRVIKETMLHPVVDNFGDYDGKQKVDRGWLTAQSLVQFKFMNNPVKLKSRKAGRLMNIKITPVKLTFGTEPHVEDSSLSTDTTENVEAPPGVNVEVSTLNNDPTVCFPQAQEQFGREYKPNDVLLINVYVPNYQNLAYLVDFYSYSSRASANDPPYHVGYTYILPNMFKPSEGYLELPVTCNVKHRPLGTVYIEYLIVNPMAEKLSNFQVSYAKHWNPAWTGLEVGHRGLGASFKANFMYGFMNRLARRFDDFQPPEQAGFRKGYSTIDHIHTLRQIIQKTEEYNLPLCLAFVDYEKAFDLIETSAVLQSLQRCHIDYRYVEVLKCLYKNATMSVRVQDQSTEAIPLQRGVRQGDVISPKLSGHAIRENTVASLKKAAASGADLLEFDVQLSKDMIPVIYHDYHVCISMKRKKEVDFSEMLELPVKDLTLEHLQKLKVYHLVEGRTNETLFNDEDLEEHQPFPTLQVLFKALDSHVGFNVELKWNMQLDDGTFELNNPFDMNVYVDKVLEVVLKYAEDRRIVFSCFNPDICTMVRNKQNKYPVMFLTQGVTKKYQPYRDPRTLSIPAAVQHAVSSDILGIVVHTEDLLRDPTQVKLVTDAGLVIFCWGDENNDKSTIKRLKLMGLHAVIYDKLDQYTTKEVKESVFMVEARESQKDLMRLAASDEPDFGTTSSASSATVSDAPPRPFLNLAVRNRLKEHSTATSLESLASSIDTMEDRRKRNLIDCIDKESQVKEQTNTFRGLFPSGDMSKAASKKSRND